MRTVTNTKLIQRNSKIGQYTTLGSLGLMVVAMIISYRMQNEPAYWLGALLVGFFLFQIGTYFTNRWGRNPRPNEVIDKSLKGLGRDFIAYHYVTPVSHLLVNPAGVWAILPYYLNGVVSYDKKRWRLKGGGVIQGYLRLFGQDTIGRPDLEAEAAIDSAQRYFKKVLPEGTEIPTIQTLLLFANPKVELNVEGAPMPALKAKDLKDFMRGKGKEKQLGESLLNRIQQALPQTTDEE